MRKYALIASIAIMAFTVRGAPLERDLGLGLVYWRVHTLPGDLPPSPARAGEGAARPCVLDLRYVHGGDGDGAVLFAWLKFHASPQAPVFLLANADTSGALLAPLDSANAVAGLVILGAAAPGFSPDIALPAAPEVERRAYDALEKGKPVESLITENLEKPRIDEEMLAREHLSDSAVADEEADDDRLSDAAPAKAPAQLMDAVLQRAVQLHRTLLALKRI